MSDVICIVAFRTDTDRAVRYKKIPIGSAETGKLGAAFDRLRRELFDAWHNDKADFVSIRFIRNKPLPTEDDMKRMFKK